MGRRTFGGDDPHKGTENEGNAFDGAWDGPQFVLTHHPPVAPVPGVTFVNDLATGLAAARAAAGDKYVNILGADVARQCIDAGELDELFVCVAPVMLGDGVRSFDYPGDAQIKFERLSLTQAPLATNLWLRDVR